MQVINFHEWLDELTVEKSDSGQNFTRVQNTNHSREDGYDIELFEETIDEFKCEVLDDEITIIVDSEIYDRMERREKTDSKEYKEMLGETADDIDGGLWHQ